MLVFKFFSPLSYIFLCFAIHYSLSIFVLNMDDKSKK